MDNKVINELQDLKYLSWTRIRNFSGAAGSYLKAYDDFGDKKKYYKLSNYNPVEGVVGYESVYEIIVDRLLTIFGISHLAYQLVHASIIIEDREYESYVCVSEDFKENGESKIALDAYYRVERESGETLLEFCIRNGWEEYIYRMLVVDYIILNRDRHGANIEILRNRQNKTIRIAPLFDHGLSLIFSNTKADKLEQLDVLADERIQCCVGSNSAFDNLKLIPRDKLPVLNKLQESDKDILMTDLDNVLSEIWQDKIWEMIWKRWKVYEDICNQR